MLERYFTLVGIIENDVKIKEGVGSLKLYEEYAYYLVNVAEQRNGDSYSSGTILQFLSYLHNDVALEKIFSLSNCTCDNDRAKRQWLMETGPGTWYCRLRSKVQQLIFEHKQSLGEDVCGKSASAGRILLFRMCEALLKQNTIDSVLRRYGLIANFIHCGRTCELIY